jgi:hypothetical protein
VKIRSRGGAKARLCIMDAIRYQSELMKEKEVSLADLADTNFPDRSGDYAGGLTYPLIDERLPVQDASSIQSGKAMN